MSAPVVLFVFNRPSHTQITVEALSKNEGAKETPLIVYADGPRSVTEQRLCDEVVAVVSGFEKQFASLTLKRSAKNKGLASAIIEGVSETLAQHESVIVMEDDLVTDPQFLSYMNAGLDRYREDARVGSIHGYMYPTDVVLPETFFIRGGDCWGWATWRRAWAVFEQDSGVLMATLKEKKLVQKFNLDGAYPYFQMLKNQSLGRISSWAIRWHAALFIKDMLTLYPGTSYVKNIGMDGSGTHQDQSSQFSKEMACTIKKREFIFPEKNEENLKARFAIAQFWMSTQRGLHKWIWQFKTRKLKG